MDRPTRLYEFDGGVLEVYDYGDDPGTGPGVYLALFNSGDSTEPDVRAVPGDIDTAAS
ncbi:hypothetical protein [Nocardia sp. NPDC051570]|uniref:hypothetical protein n=1 Tax=Nocardia sp. NPDC051570 TaxID=3364324 RepID=UPI0037AD2A72